MDKGRTGKRRVGEPRARAWGSDKRAIWLHGCVAGNDLTLITDP